MTASVLDDVMVRDSHTEVAMTLRDYLIKLLTALWTEPDLSGKRPFGNSGWRYDVYAALIRQQLVPGTIDTDGYVASVNQEQADEIILAAISTM